MLTAREFPSSKPFDRTERILSYLIMLCTVLNVAIPVAIGPVLFLTVRNIYPLQNIICSMALIHRPLSLK